MITMLKPRPDGFRSIEQRLWDKVVKGDGCWVWVGALTPLGYGTMNTGSQRRASRSNRNQYVHQIAWELAMGGHPCLRGPLPRHICVLHHCDNPPCVRLDHLFVGTKKTNSQDMAAKGRWRNQYGAGR